MTRKSVPVIDISGFRLTDPTQRLAVAREVGQACRDIDFLIISGHGVPDSLIGDCYRTSK
jgi:isopenicillin N synthase-like dioxygenase